MAVIFDGKKLAEEKLGKLKTQVEDLAKQLGRSPKIVVLMVGANKASRIYVQEKKEAAEKIGVDFKFLHFPSSIDIKTVIQSIKVANEDELVDGVMVQLPIEIKNEKLKMKNYKAKFKILNAIDMEKDVDCLTEENLRLLKIGKPRFLPATVKAILEILNKSNVNGQWLKVTVVGAKGFVGRPLTWALKNKGFDVVGLDLETKNLTPMTSQADILISCTGQPKLIKEEMVKKGALVIDVGYPQGDVDFKGVKNKASFITPVPGGVGPMTVVSLLENLMFASEARLG